MRPIIWTHGIQTYSVFIKMVENQQPTQLSTAVLYDTDFMAWCETQANLLRTHNYDQLDHANLLEELEDMGREQFRKTLSLVRQIIIHILQVQTFPSDQACHHWRSEVVAFQNDLEDVVSGSIRHRFEQQEAFNTQQQKALRQLSKKYPETTFQTLEKMSLDELIHWSDPDQ
ncbi:MAG: DUF29 domain-containing protein [Cyanothece sp. SIO2G6]|nr:DUF29 domain-containing protein [Cyanothece sp. SIO2G6]